MKILLIIIAISTIGYFFIRRKKNSANQLPGEVFLDPETKEFINNTKKLGRPYSDFIDVARDPPKLLAVLREKHKSQSLEKLTKLYYSLMNQMQKAKKNRDFKKMSMYSQMSLGLIEPLILQNKFAYGSFQLGSIPALEEPLSYYAINGYGGQIQNIEEIVNFFPELSRWKEAVDRAREITSVSLLLMKTIKDNPGTLQKDIKNLINVDDGKKVANVLYYMELYGQIRKEKAGKTNKLFAV